MATRGRVWCILAMLAYPVAATAAGTVLCMIGERSFLSWDRRVLLTYACDRPAHYSVLRNASRPIRRVVHLSFHYAFVDACHVDICGL